MCGTCMDGVGYNHPLKLCHSILGPDIDTPEKEKNARLQEFLNQGSAHAPTHSAQFPVQTVARQTSDAGIQCDSQSATSSLSSTSTSSSEPSGEKERERERERERFFCV